MEGVERGIEKVSEDNLGLGEEVCGKKNGKRRKWSEWWSEEIGRIVGRKKECFLI